MHYLITGVIQNGLVTDKFYMLSWTQVILKYCGYVIDKSFENEMII